MDDGWSIKSLHRKIVLSSTYRKSSDHSKSEPAMNGPTKSGLSEVRLLARFPRTRLEAEIIRDITMKSAGLLSLKQGGPPVRPPQPDGISESSFGRPKWRASTGEDRYRRSVYTYQKRTAPFAMLTTFDAPSGEACIARRDVSNTALQALTLLNDEMFLEAARALGKLLAESHQDDQSRIESAFARVLTRPPSERETTRLLTFVADQRSVIDTERKAATEAKSADDRTVEIGVWTNVARALFSLDETLTKN